MLLQLLAETRSTEGEDEQALRAAWSQAWSAARERWPRVELDEAVFAAWIVKRLPPESSALEGLASLRVEDLYLACACVRGDAAAMRAFETSHGAALEGAARRGGASQPDEVVQRLRERLFVGPTAKLRDYAGLGSLARWLKIAARRLAIDMGRVEQRRRPARDAGDDLATPLASADPELQLLKARYRELFAQAFALAMRNLTPRARTMLRLHLIHRLSIDEIAPMHDVHRATAARWLARARAEVLEGTRTHLAELLETDMQDVDSIMQMIASRLDLSIARHLETNAE